jgi:hypothetical protein
MSICSGVRKNGQACTARALPDSALCWAHDARPDAAAKRAEARRAGGFGRSMANRSLKAMPFELRTVFQTLLALVDEVRSGTLEPQQATAIAALAGKLLDFGKFALDVGEAAELRQRLDALEAATNQQHQQQRRFRA